YRGQVAHLDHARAHSDALRVQDLDSAARAGLDAEPLEADVLRVDNEKCRQRAVLLGHGLHARTRIATVDDNVVPALDQHTLVVDAGQHADGAAACRQGSHTILDRLVHAIARDAVANGDLAAATQLRQRQKRVPAIVDNLADDASERHSPADQAKR